MVINPVIITALQQIRALPVTTMTGRRLVAVWRPKEDRWYIVEAGSGGGMENPKKVIDKPTPRQFQDALEDGQYLIIMVGFQDVFCSSATP